MTERSASRDAIAQAGPAVARRLSVIGVPSSAGARRAGQERAPESLRAAGLIEMLRSRGIDVEDTTDIPTVRFRPDPRHPRQQNLDLVVQTTRRVAALIGPDSSDGRQLLVLGGDCTVTIGVVSGLSRRDSRLGLIYIDGDLDLNTPATSPSGAFDGMVAAHLLGHGAHELAQVGPAHPLVQDACLVFFGYSVAAGGIDPPEIELLTKLAAPRFPLEVVRPDPAAAARAALEFLEGRVDRILVHFDIDVTANAAADVPHANGLSPEHTVEALKVLLASPRCAGLVATEFNPELDADGSAARRHARLIADAFGNSPGLNWRFGRG